MAESEREMARSGGRDRRAATGADRPAAGVGGLRPLPPRPSGGPAGRPAGVGGDGVGVEPARGSAGRLGSRWVRATWRFPPIFSGTSSKRSEPPPQLTAGTRKIFSGWPRLRRPTPTCSRPSSPQPLSGPTWQPWSLWLDGGRSMWTRFCSSGGPWRLPVSPRRSPRDRAPPSRARTGGRTPSLPRVRVPSEHRAAPARGRRAHSDLRPLRQRLGGDTAGVRVLWSRRARSVGDPSAR